MKGAWGVVPSVCVTERYDSNVYYAPSSTPGIRLDDYVTDVFPNIRVNHNGDYASGFVNVGGFSETYVYNTGLNYIGFTGNLDLNLNNSVKKLLPNASLRVTDLARYTPLPPGLVNPIAGTSPNDPSNNQNALAQQLLTYRTNTWGNNVNVFSSYATSASTSLQASYSNSIIRYGSSPLGNNKTALGTLFDTTINSESVGGLAQLSGLDTVIVTYAHSDFVYKSGTEFSFQSDSATVGWSRILTPSLKAELGGGGIIVSPGLTTWGANAALMLITPDNRATLSYVRTAYPGVVGTAVPLIANIVALSATQKLSRDWELTESANYFLANGATSATNSGSGETQFRTYSASVGLYYWLTRVWSTALTYDYMDYESQFAGTNYSFNRHVITVGVKATWE